MDNLGLNIKYLRKSKGFTQTELANNLGVNRAMIGSYEENRAVPKLSVLQDIAYFFSISIDDLIKLKLWEENNNGIKLNTDHLKGNKLRILTTVVDKDDKELVSAIPIKASAGYTNGFSDPEFIEELPHFSLPLNELSKERTYRVFQIKGDSMLPLTSGSYVICEYISNWEDIRDNKTYIVISKDEGIVYKRLINNIKSNNEIILKSDNTEYTPYKIKADAILEVWKALGFISFNLPNSQDNNLSISDLHQMIVQMKGEIDQLKS
jgi:transcriptional regulator with XRE-family HTH domain